MPYKGIILDFNGTLIWDTPLHKATWFSLSEELGYNITETQYYNDLHGLSAEDIFRILMKKELDPEEMAGLLNIREEFYRKSCLENPDIYHLAPGVEEFLDYLESRSFPRSIATASAKENLDFFIETLGLDRWFDESQIVYNDGRYACKPSPEIYLEAASRLRLKPSDCLIVEDTYYGALAARSAGAGYLIVTGPAEDQHDELDGLEGVSQFISDFAEIDRSLFSE